MPAVQSGGGAFGGVDGGLEEDLETLDRNAGAVIKALEDGCRVAIKEVEIGEIDGDVCSGLFVEIGCDAFEKERVVE